MRLLTLSIVFLISLVLFTSEAKASESGFIQTSRKPWTLSPRMNGSSEQTLRTFVRKPRVFNPRMFINIVNPVRKSFYTKDSSESISAQYKIIKENNLPATWLLTYDVLIDDKSLQVFLDMDDKQEFGILLEVTKSLAEASGDEYNDTGSWHHATSVFLSGYTQSERKMLIDTVFDKFKEQFGYYPTSVGSWWTDSYSLSHMQDKYGITANLGVSDQFSTDGYQVWGTYWSTPYYPSKYNAGIPASDPKVKLDLVTIQWAPRDPLLGYKSSLYSTQDYLVVGESLDISYFEKLVETYLGSDNNKFGQITVGLEGDLNPADYQKEYKNQIETVRMLVGEKDYKAVTMSQFSSWYRDEFQDLSPAQLIDSFKTHPIDESRVVWYQSSKYRVGIKMDVDGAEIFDFRSYHSDLIEPYYFSPNGSFQLHINIPSYFDSASDKNSVWDLSSTLGRFEKISSDGESASLLFEKGEVVLKSDRLEIFGSFEIPESIVDADTLDVMLGGTTEILPTDKWTVGKEGYLFRDLTDVATRQLIRKRNLALLTLGLVTVIAFGVAIRLSKLSERKKFIALTFVIFVPLVGLYFWYMGNSETYYVSQDEVQAIRKLANEPAGKILVVDRECLGCVWHTKYKPAVFSNKRGYVSKLSGKEVIHNLEVFSANTQDEAKEEFHKSGAKYIYLSRYEEYEEKLQFSPGDYGIELFFQNANAQVWRKVE